MQKSGINLCFLFGIFLVLKLTGYINWSWWWVTVPLWGVFALVVLIIGVTLTIALICDLSTSAHKLSRGEK